MTNDRFLDRAWDFALDRITDLGLAGSDPDAAVDRGIGGYYVTIRYGAGSMTWFLPDHGAEPLTEEPSTERSTIVARNSG